MSRPQSAPSLPSRPRTKRQPEEDSLEDLLAAHKTQRGSGQLPAEGVVLIGVDLELQQRMAARHPVTLSNDSAPYSGARPTNALDDLGTEPQFPAPISRPVLQFRQPPNATALDFGAPQFGAPLADAPNIGAPISTAPDDIEPNFSALEFTKAATSSDNTGALYLGAPNFSAPEFDIEDLFVRRTASKTYTIHPVSRIEDVFTSSERDLIRWLWERGRQVPTTAKLRLATGANGEGARRLAAQAGLVYNTFKNLTRALSTKLAVDIVKPDRNLAAIYVIYHYSAILERQRLAGLSGVVHKNGGGRELVTATGHPAPGRPDLSPAQLKQIIGAPKFSTPNGTPVAPNFSATSANSGAPNFGASIRNKEYTSVKENTSTTSTAPAPHIGAPAIVMKALFERTGQTDSDAASAILNGCREVNPTTQPDEIARLIRTYPIPSTIGNPMGLLISKLPSKCAPGSIENYREQWRADDEREERRQRRERAERVERARAILQSAAQGDEWDNETLEDARRILADDEAGPIPTFVSPAAK